MVTKSQNRLAEKMRGISKYRRPSVIISKRYHKIDTSLSLG